MSRSPVSDGKNNTASVLELKTLSGNANSLPVQLAAKGVRIYVQFFNLMRIGVETMSSGSAKFCFIL